MNATAPTRFPCRQCGAQLAFEPGTTSIVCPYCRAENQIQADAADVQELDFHQAVASLQEAAPIDTVPVVHCDSCGANVEVPDRTTSFPCPFCAANIVSQARACPIIRPNALLPFAVTRDKAIDAFRAWLKSRWFAPSALKREGRLDASITGVYFPAFTFDTHTTTAYTGQRGDAYYVTRTRIVNGRPQSYSERRIRWSSAAGTVLVPFDDVLVEATSSLPAEDVNRLAPWDLKACLPYNDQFLAGFRAEAYDQKHDLPASFVRAQGLMAPTIDSAICADIGGDEQRISSKRTRYDQLTFKHILLPVWVSAYRYNNTVYRFLVNARTSEVTGQRPYSAWKITGAVLAAVAALGIIFLIINAR